MKNHSKIDPVTLRVLGGAFDTIAKEMALHQYRMAHCTLVTESEDLGCGLFMPDGRQIAESGNSPLHCGSIGGYIRGVLKKLEGDIQEGDVIAHNNPYMGASHTPDVGIIIPIFHEDRLIGFAGSTSHWVDIGGSQPGINLDALDMWAEGIIFSGAKLYEAGKRNEQLWEFIWNNVRTPHENRGDCLAQIAACQFGKRRFLELVRRYGYETVMAAAERWMDYAEEALRLRVKAVPPGAYFAEGWLDDDGKNRGKRLRVATKVIVSEDGGLTVDLTGSASETETGFNCPFYGATCVGVYAAVRSIFLDEYTLEEPVPQNEGIFRAVRVVAPLGSMFNPRFPKGTFARLTQIQRVADNILKALAPVLPEPMRSAGTSAHIHWLSYSGFRPDTGDYWVHLEPEAGGSFGGRHGRDGSDATAVLCTNTRNVPIEHMEKMFPLRCERYELRDEPPAAGRWRSGLGIVRVNRVLAPTIVSCEGDRHFDPPWGVLGGKQGRPGSLTKIGRGGKREPWPSKFTGWRLEAGEALEIKTPVGGGYGDPYQRDPQKVLDDVLDGYISLETAKSDYGVVINPQTMQVDTKASEKLRKSFKFSKQ
ncbi:hydantoinase B/oxoprolinase family protein [Candidatus Hecatella orcuttiae]|uniref:hydantoinase B/oxoprolinase family protein n=1 Tax=Candidatus Hecatella orcuttiae TaxID=1935119 RepID=UPI00286813E0|nr:hydantoinase B/oxoprolinase family protein [Candidatus Hecatella orcuttiae]